MNVWAESKACWGLCGGSSEAGRRGDQIWGLDFPAEALGSCEQGLELEADKALWAALVLPSFLPSQDPPSSCSRGLGSPKQWDRGPQGRGFPVREPPRRGPQPATGSDTHSLRKSWPHGDPQLRQAGALWGAPTGPASGPPTALRRPRGLLWGAEDSPESGTHCGPSPWENA